jgi:hypothetical protein
MIRIDDTTSVEGGDDLIFIENEGLLYRGPDCNDPTEIWHYIDQRWVEFRRLSSDDADPWGQDIDGVRAEKLKTNNWDAEHFRYYVSALGYEGTIRRSRKRESGVWTMGFILDIGVINTNDLNHTVYMIATPAKPGYHWIGYDIGLREGNRSWRLFTAPPAAAALPSHWLPMCGSAAAHVDDGVDMRRSESHAFQANRFQLIWNLKFFRVPICADRHPAKIAFLQQLQAPAQHKRRVSLRRQSIVSNEFALAQANQTCWNDSGKCVGITLLISA